MTSRAPIDDEAGVRRYVRRDDVLWRRTRRSAVVCRPEGDVVVSLSGTGAFLWDLLAEPISITDTVEFLANLFATPPDEVASDVTAALDELVDRALCQVVPEP